MAGSPASCGTNEVRQLLDHHAELAAAVGGDEEAGVVTILAPKVDGFDGISVLLIPIVVMVKVAERNQVLG
jgi:hypothetical protein